MFGSGSVVTGNRGCSIMARETGAAGSEDNVAGPGPGKPPMILDQGLVDEIVEAIEEGCTDYIAAESLGMSLMTFRRYLAYGQAQEMCDEDPSLNFMDVMRERFSSYIPSNGMIREEHLDMYATFYSRVMAANGSARRRMEKLVTQTEPFKWLRYGPGRERPGRPGWGDHVIVTGNESGPVDHRIEVVDYRQAISPLRPPPESADGD